MKRKYKELAQQHAASTKRKLHEINGHIYSFDENSKEPDYYTDYEDYVRYNYNMYDNDLWDKLANPRKKHLRKRK